MTKIITKFLQQQTLILMQTMLGVISPNFRMVSITAQNNEINIQVVLEHESEEDLEELEDSKSEFEALQSEPINYEFNVIVSKDKIEWQKDSTIVIYRRRE